MLFRVLGPLEVEVGAERITIAGERSRALLVALVLAPGTAVPTSRLVDTLWPDAPPEDPANALHQAVRRLRAALGPLGALVRRRAPGYELAVDPAAVDAERFEAACREARRVGAADPAGAVRLLEEALALWRGPAYGEFADGPARAAAVRLEELRTTALEERAARLLAAGAVADAVAAARDLVEREPLRARPVEVLVQALAADGRPAEAVEAYHRHRRLVADELGMDPSPELRELATRVLRGDTRRPVPRVPSPSRALPWRPDALLGREEDLALLRSCLRTQQLVTVVGPGGVGKTRLVLEVAHELAAGGTRVWWADLSTADADRLADVVAGALGAETPRGPDAVGALAATLGGFRGVLCLDNAETVLAPLAPLVERLLEAAPGLTLLATSRERLEVAREHVHLLAPLPLPSGADRGNPAVRLFLDRAPGLEAGRLPDDDVEVVALICRRLDGLPLAIEIGAARAPALGLHGFAEHLDRGLGLLTGGRRTAAERHRSVRAVVDWSFGLLTGDEARLFLRLGVFPASFSLDRVEAVCGDDGVPAAEVAGLLGRLVDKSLVQGGRGRFWLLETLRAYARERCDPGERAVLARRHAEDVAARLAALSPRLAGPDEAEVAAAVAALEPDLHVAWAHAVRHDRGLAVQMAADVMDYAYVRQRLDLLEWGATVAGWEGVEHPRLPDALAAAAAAAWAVGRIAEAGELARRGVEAAGGFDAPSAGRAVNQCACVAMFRTRGEEAADLFGLRARLHRAVGEEVMGLLGDLSVHQALTYAGRAAEAVEALGPLLQRARELGNPGALSWGHYVLGEAQATLDPARALAAYDACIEHGMPVGNKLYVMLARTSAVALVAVHQAPQEAIAEFERVLGEWEEIGSELSQWWVLQNLAVSLTRAGAWADAALLAGAVSANADRFPAFVREEDGLQRAVDELGHHLGAAELAALLEEGSRLPIAAAAAHARAAIRRAT
ncbi:BTAD domain-containing putative transcriptional regulator [Geodermatophilus sp. SYSU D00758]